MSRLFRWLHPKPQIEDPDVRRGMRLLLADGACAQVVFVLTTGAFLVGFALMLGASNKMVGLLAAVGPLSLTLQIPAVYLLERLRRRKALVVGSISLSRAVWLFIAAIPWVVPKPYMLPAFLVALFLHFALGSVGGCAFNSWIRDLIPQKDMATFFAKRLAIATAIGALLSLAGGYAIDVGREQMGRPDAAYAGIFVVAAVVGLAGVITLARTPEPQMPSETDESISKLLLQPLHDKNFRQLLIFLGWWSFAVNFATPFFAVYLIERLKLEMTMVLGLGVLSQLINVACFRLWGNLADRFNNKSVLVLTGPWFIFSFLLWPLTTLPEQYFLTVPILVLIHVLAGISTAGVNLCAGNLALKIAPYGRAGAYLAVNALISGLAATVAPILAGFAADWFASEEVRLTIEVTSLAGRHSDLVVPALDIKGLDFVFVIAFLCGLYSVHRLLSVKEEGEVRESVVRQAFLGEIVRNARQISTIAGARQLISFPFDMVKRIGGKRDTEGSKKSRQTPSNP